MIIDWLVFIDLMQCNMKFLQAILDDLRKNEIEIKTIVEESKQISQTSSIVHSTWCQEYLIRYHQVCFLIFSSFHAHYFYDIVFIFIFPAFLL